MFDGVSLSDHTFQSPAMPSLPLRQPSPGSTSSMNDRHLEPPQTYEVLLQTNSALKTRVNELEVINGLYQGTVRQYQQVHQPAPQAEMIPQDTDSLQQLLQQSQQREEDLKRQVEDLEREVAELRGDQPPAKRTRLSTASEYPEPPQTFAANGLHSWIPSQAGSTKQDLKIFRATNDTLWDGSVASLELVWLPYTQSVSAYPLPLSNPNVFLIIRMPLEALYYYYEYPLDTCEKFCTTNTLLSDEQSLAFLLLFYLWRGRDPCWAQQGWRVCIDHRKIKHSNDKSLVISHVFNCLYVKSR